MATQAAVTADIEWVPSVSFGDRLRVVRRGRHRTQEEMASLLGVKKVTYGTWEAGTATPSHDEVVRIAKQLFLLDRVPQWWTLGADEPTDRLRVGARSSTDRASDYGSEFGDFFPFRRHGGRARGRRHLSVVPLYLGAGEGATA